MELDRQITNSLEKLIQVQRILLWDIAKKENLSPIQIQFLIFINNHSDKLRRVSGLAEEFDLTKATVSDAVSNLVEKGLIKKIKTEEDKRSYLLELTPEGKNIAIKITNWDERLTESIGKIPENQKVYICQFLIELIKSLFDDGVINVARLCLTCANIKPGSSDEPNQCSLTGRLFFNNEINIDCDNFEVLRKK